MLYPLIAEQEARDAQERRQARPLVLAIAIGLLLAVLTGAFGSWILPQSPGLPNNGSVPHDFSDAG